MIYKEFKNYYELESFFKEKELFIFTYGFLMWNPCFFFIKNRFLLSRVILRDFCIYIYKGTRDYPSLVLGLRKQEYSKNNTCTRLLFSFSQHQEQEGLKEIWDREMVFNVYISTVLQVQEKNIITFVANEKSKSFCQLSLEKKRFIIKNAAGSKGSCLEYFESTKNKLAQFGLQDARLKNLL